MRRDERQAEKEPVSFELLIVAVNALYPPGQTPSLSRRAVGFFSHWHRLFDPLPHTLRSSTPSGQPALGKPRAKLYHEWILLRWHKSHANHMLTPPPPPQGPSEIKLGKKCRTRQDSRSLSGLEAARGYYRRDGRNSLEEKYRICPDAVRTPSQIDIVGETRTYACSTTMGER